MSLTHPTPHERAPIKPPSSHWHCYLCYADANEIRSETRNWSLVLVGIGVIGAFCALLQVWPP